MFWCLVCFWGLNDHRKQSTGAHCFDYAGYFSVGLVQEEDAKSTKKRSSACKRRGKDTQPLSKAFESQRGAGMGNGGPSTTRSTSE